MIQPHMAVQPVYTNRGIARPGDTGAGYTGQPVPVLTAPAQRPHIAHPGAITSAHIPAPAGVGGALPIGPPPNILSQFVMAHPHKPTRAHHVKITPMPRPIIDRHPVHAPHDRPNDVTMRHAPQFR